MTLEEALLGRASQAPQGPIPLASMGDVSRTLQIAQPDPGTVTPADAYSYNAGAVGDYIARQRAAAVQQGLWNPDTGMPTAAGVADAARQYASGVMMGSTAPKAPITAFHGSSYDFDAFDAGKIGTGEGAQAYGHGLYFAGNEGVARGYRDRLSSDTYRMADGQIFDPQTQLQHLNVRVAARNNGLDLDKTIARAQELLPRASQQTAPMLQHDIEFLKSVKDAGGLTQPHAGRMYEVNIHADPEHFLDWDKPLSEQLPQVQEAILPHVKAAIDKEYVSGNVSNPLNLTGESAYGATASVMPSFERGASTGYNQEASAALHQAGVPGIKYLDAGSRGAGEGSHNFVIFDPKLLQIVRKYSVPAFASSSAIPYAMSGTPQTEGGQ